MARAYRRPRAHREFFNEFEIKRSKFLTFIARVEDEEQARAFIAEIRSRYPDARHHCSAYLYHVDGSNPIERSSDDGEPSGTAGTPMLDVLRGSGLLDIAAVTVRYFGGIKLGAGGLVHAYSDSVMRCLDQVESVSRARQDLFQADFNYSDAGKIEAELRGRGFHVTEVEYKHRAHFTIAVDPGGKAELESFLAALTAGGARLTDAGSTWVESNL
ncbi:YigZ family protein [Corynebacterium sp. ES2794-CONJ1]|uniref:YigZ family protein n=1 Tax=unclassified Corynebacterium TaxID=2624378 RepID=UPI0021690FBB|nr:MULTISPECIES: YigZ family protein [unclassified Corynebacterium]MCS4489038.1 YigZ family protein [Corynebacterium sp. ES2775-CONJ]MCS4490851.1 YigZ family protein [Corynebacterium sp. ES2715-CONJ3]MCS4531266.1 YigZ family protein [Corynebacterium sp. ES2730-CONJ]MCU9518635.1 YigZ family protein [Corynebacterium sp. ES2794-CONJ1]